MSEKLYSWLLRLYPARFREAYGEEALQLFRDRLHDEPGLLLRLRLWLDLISDFALSLPRQYRRVQPATVGAQSMFSLIEDRPLRPERLLAGAALTLLIAYSLVLFARLEHFRPPDLSHFMPGQDGPNFPHGREPKMTVPEPAALPRAGAPQNCILEKLEILPHNIGYLKLDSIPEPSACLAVSTAALDAVNRVGAVILDLRDTGDGSAAIASFLAFQFARKPLFILTSRRSSSAAGHIIYNLRILRRATIVGEETAGVEPDVKVNAADALATAERLWGRLQPVDGRLAAAGLPETITEFRNFLSI